MKTVAFGVTFMETLRRQWRGIIFWGGGIGFLAFIQVIIVPTVDALEQMAELMETLPPALMQAFGGEDAAFMSTPEGYLAVQYFSMVALVFAAYAVAAGINVTANDEDKGILDMTLSLPIPRWQMIVEKALAYSLLIVAINLVSLFGLWLGILPSTAINVDMGRILVANLNILPVAFFVFGFTIMISVMVRRRSQALAIASALVIIGYFVDTIGLAASNSIINDLRVFSYYRYYDFTEVVKNGLVMENVLILMVAAVICFAASLFFFQRRDISV